MSFRDIRILCVTFVSYLIAMRFNLILLFSFLFLLGISKESAAQCTQCTPDVTCYQPGGTQCPPSGQAPPMYQNNPYSTVVTFDMPPDTNVSPIGVVEIVNVQYASISGLPIGINWSCNNTGNGCQYNPSAGETKACITFCGTPLSPPGNYTVTINIYGTADTPIGNQTQYQPLNYTFTILADSSSNGYFSMTPSAGCDSIDVSFDATYALPLPNTVSYEWDLDNGTTFVGQTPPQQTYNTPGVYAPTLITHVNKLVVKKVTTSVSGNWWCGDVEEPNWPGIGCTASPEVYFNLQHGTNVYTSSATNGSTTGTWDNLGIDLSTSLFSISLWDEDGTSQDDFGGSQAVNVTGAGIYNYITSGGFGTIEILEVFDYDVITSDTITVHASPQVVDITATPSDTVCEKVPVTLSVYAGDYTYTWYKNGNAISDTLGNSITVLNQNAEYSVHLVDNVTGCSAWMNPIHTYFKPGVYNMYITYENGVLVNNPPTGFTYQWTFNGTPIFPGGTSGTYTPSAVGTYACMVSNEYGCSDTTSNYVVNSLAGIADFTDVSDYVSLFPNPATESISLSYPSSNACEAHVRVVNSMGSVVMNKNLVCSGGQNTFVISVSDFASGVYYLEFKTDKGFAAKRFIKQ